MQPDFRTLLREETRTDHEQLDKLFTRVDIATVAGFVQFAQVHVVCFDAMRAQADGDSWAATHLVSMASCLRDDLSMLGATCVVKSQPIVDRCDPLAIEYMVAGSRLGSRILYKRWAGGSNARLRAAGHYFGLDDLTGQWRDTCARLSKIPAHSPRAGRIVADTRGLFGLFVTIYDQLIDQNEAELQ